MIPHDWTHFRAIDYHELSPWAIIFVSLSGYDEAFVWGELNPSPEKNTTKMIAEMIADKSGDYKFQMNLVDPLAMVRQSNTGSTVVEDLNHIFNTYRKEGRCSGGTWESWDTKATVGRDRVRERLMNASMCKKPFNNEILKDGIPVRVPTLWIFNSCVNTYKSLQLWRLEKDRPAQMWSHFCMTLEALMKDVRFRPRRIEYAEQRKSPHSSYFRTNR